jgi:acylphosphatase
MATSADTNASAPPQPQKQQEEPVRKAVHVVVKGRVQGVGFRDWTASTAESLGLAGWVRNRRDGTVEALLSGEPSKVDEMVSRRLPVGPPASAVTAVVPSPAEPVHPSTGFEIKFTV